MQKFNNPLRNLIVPNLYNEYSHILSLTNIPLFLIDIYGDIILELIPSPSFCTQLCQESNNKLCSDYMCHLPKKCEVRFTCKYGLENILLPIVVHNKVLGYIGGMQVFTKENEYKKHMIDIKSFNKDSNINLEFVAKSIASLSIVDLDKIKVHEQLCAQMAKNISLDIYENINNPNKELKRLSIEKEVLEKKIIDLEAKNISLAINPHFLFNTLNCIARIAYFENSHTTEKLIYCLSDLLRYNLKQDNQLHTIEAEINNIEKYLYIQKARFRNRLEYSINIPEEIKPFKILNMIIQPIVENAIIHGIASKRNGGKVMINAEKNNNKITIFVADNGNGFPENVLKNLNQTNDKSGLGFKNTDKRLKHYYGKEYGLEIVKSDYSGSTIAISIPAQPIVR